MRPAMNWKELSKFIERCSSKEGSQYSLSDINKAIRKKSYLWFDDMPNIVAVRNMQHNQRVTNKYDDRITLSFKKSDRNCFFCWPCTTDPGMFYLQNLIHYKGAAILAPGQYLNCYRLGLHQGKYLALIQAKGKVNVYRDSNYDDTYDMHCEEFGFFGINIHKPETQSSDVDHNSAGCIVFKHANDFDLFIQILLHFKKKLKNTFTFTLIESTDLQIFSID